MKIFETFCDNWSYNLMNILTPLWSKQLILCHVMFISIKIGGRARIDSTELRSLISHLCSFFFHSKRQSQVWVELPGHRLPLLRTTSWEGHWWHPLWSEWHSHLCLGTVQGKCHWAWESVVRVFNLWLMVSQGWGEPACRLRVFGLWEYRHVMLAFQSLTGLFAHCILHRALTLDTVFPGDVWCSFSTCEVEVVDRAWLS